jgi:hypothetical protein
VTRRNLSQIKEEEIKIELKPSVFNKRKLTLAGTTGDDGFKK